MHTLVAYMRSATDTELAADPFAAHARVGRIHLPLIQANRAIVATRVAFEGYAMTLPSHLLANRHRP